jgi:hypothetical protein
MVDDFLASEDPAMPPEERRALALTLDPSLLSPAYEAELKRNVVQHFLNGRTARLVLIQVQFLKKELLRCVIAVAGSFRVACR